MDYSKVKYVKPSVDGLDIIKDKVYNFDFSDDSTGYVIDENNDRIYIYIPQCYHLNREHWIPCTKDGTPL